MRTPKYTHIIIFCSLLLLIILFQFVIPHSNRGMSFYIDYIFAPLQNFRLQIMNQWMISIGDLIYLLLFIYLLFLVLRFTYLIITRRKNRKYLKSHSRLMLISILSIFLCLAVVWNVNYSREKIYKQLPNWDKSINSKEAAITLHHFLIEQFQMLDSIPFIELNEIALNQSLLNTYKQEFGDKLPNLYTKKSMFGNIIEAMGIQGYYNPLTGENQYNDDVPKFLHPFIIAHEMAHQLGVAAEGDANLVGYITCVNSIEPSIQYSGYFNLFLYNINSIKKIDKSLAENLINDLPAYVKQDYNTLMDFRNKHRNLLSDFTIPIYNFFLKTNGQEGVKAYRNLAHYGYIYELVNKRKANLSIRPYN